MTIEEPFLFRGEPLYKGRTLARFDGLKQAERKFPRLNSCLKSRVDDAKALRADQLQLNWDIIKSVDELDVCIFRITYRLRDQSTIGSWLVSEGFPSPRIQERSAGGLVRYGGTGPGRVLHTEWFKQAEALPFSERSSEFGKSMQQQALGLSVVVYLSDEDGVLHVMSSFWFT